jgi:hypothetical protein
MHPSTIMFISFGGMYHNLLENEVITANTSRNVMVNIGYQSKVCYSYLIG